MPYTDNLLNEVMSRGCEGYGFVICFCGGDLCVCGLDGQLCPGCNECKWEDWQQEIDETEEEYRQCRRLDEQG